MRYAVPVAASVAVLTIFAFSSMTGIVTYVQRPAEYGCPGCNVIFISVDTLRADHVSAYGHHSLTTSNIDALASEGIVFTNAYSQIPHTPPSHWSMFTGLYPFRHGMYLPGDNGTGLVTLPELLSAEGYVTGAFTSSRMVSGFNHEFDYFNWHPGMRKEELFTSRQANETTDQALSWMHNHSAERLFMWIHYFDPHSPYNPPEGHEVFDYGDSPFYAARRYDNLGISRARSMREEIAKYDGEIRYADEAIGRVFVKAKELGLLDNTVFILMSDHGECFGEHNFSDFGYDKNKACVFHGKTLYNQEVWIPMIIINPASDYRGARIGTVVESVDIFPTILEMLGFGAPESDGESLVPLVTSGSRDKDYAFMQTRPTKSLGFSVGIKSGGWKLVRMVPSDADIWADVAEQEGNTTLREGPLNDSGSAFDDNETKVMLFLEADGETVDHSQEGGLILRSLEDKLAGILSKALFITADEPGEDAKKLLISLGYMQ
jgi:arylsulfatase A-like enzyme